MLYYIQPAKELPSRPHWRTTDLWDLAGVWMQAFNVYSTSRPPTIWRELEMLHRETEKYIYRSYMLTAPPKCLFLFRWSFIVVIVVVIIRIRLHHEQPVHCRQHRHWGVLLPEQRYNEICTVHCYCGAVLGHALLAHATLHAGRSHMWIDLVGDK